MNYFLLKNLVDTYTTGVTQFSKKRKSTMMILLNHSRSIISRKNLYIKTFHCIKFKPITVQQYTVIKEENTAVKF